MKSSEVVQALGALASESRLAVFRLLVKGGSKGSKPSELLEQLQLPPPTLSFHLKELVHAGLVNSRREGRNLYYGPNVEHMSALVGYLMENCCSQADRTGGEPHSRPDAPASPSRKRA